MKENIFNRVYKELKIGLIGPYINSFLQHLVSLGYSENKLGERFEILTDLAAWLTFRRIKLCELNQNRIFQFKCYRMKQNGNVHLSTFNEFILFLRSKELIPQTITTAGSTSLEKYINSFDLFLKNDRGLAAGTRHNYCYFVRLFLQSHFESKRVWVNKISPQNITDFILSYTQEKKFIGIQNLTGSLRSFFRFLRMKNEIKENLADHVPTVSRLWQGRLPEHLTQQEIKKLLKSCDKKSAIGLRDYAILLMLSSLGVRASEVVKLTLDDINWSRAEIVFHTKGSKKIILPLFNDLGEALVAYLKKGRPKCSTRSFFIRSRAPFRGLMTSSSIGSIVCRALKAAGLNPLKKGAHLLRHSLATELLRKGATLSEIGLILNHDEVDTTAIYAKVDFDRLRIVASPWPKGLKFGGAK